MRTTVNPLLRRRKGISSSSTTGLTGAVAATPVRMRIIAITFLFLAATYCLRVAHAGERERILNLKEIEPSSFRVANNRLFITVTGRPPHVLTFTNLAPVPLRRSDPSGRSSIVSVTYDKDLIGCADIRVLQPTPKAPKAPVTTIYLMFETGEQASAAAQALRLRYATPTPLQKESR